MDATTAQQTIQATLWMELLKLGIFTVFVTSIIEVTKGLSAMGIGGFFKDLWYTLTTGKGMQCESILVLNFVIALVCCWAFDYGVITKIIDPGVKFRAGFAGWIDYVGTAALIYTGADSLFKKFSAMRKGWEVEKKGA
jgi:hypothetical protein